MTGLWLAQSASERLAGARSGLGTPERGGEIARLGLRTMVAGNLAAFLSASIRMPA